MWCVVPVATCFEVDRVAAASRRPQLRHHFFDTGAVFRALGSLSICYVELMSAIWNLTAWTSHYAPLDLMIIMAAMSMAAITHAMDVDAHT